MLFVLLGFAVLRGYARRAGLQRRRGDLLLQASRTALFVTATFAFQRRESDPRVGRVPVGPRRDLPEEGRRHPGRAPDLAGAFLALRRRRIRRKCGCSTAIRTSTPLFAAPFVALFGTNGFLIFHAVLLTLCFGAAYRFLMAAPGAAAAFATVFLFRVGGADIVSVTPERFKLLVDVLRLLSVRLQAGARQRKPPLSST